MSRSYRISAGFRWDCPGVFSGKLRDTPVNLLQVVRDVVCHLSEIGDRVYRLSVSSGSGVSVQLPQVALEEPVSFEIVLCDCVCQACQAVLVGVFVSQRRYECFHTVFKRLVRLEDGSSIFHGLVQHEVQISVVHVGVGDALDAVFAFGVGVVLVPSVVRRGSESI